MSSGMSSPSGEWTLSRGRVTAFAVLLFVDFVLVLVMLATDKNLQLDFGSTSSRYYGYYVHWWGLLAEGIVDLIVALGLVVFVILPAMKGRPIGSRRPQVLLALAWNLLAIIAMLAIVETWQQVGFTSMSQFVTYLFGTSAYPGALSYIPWLYDALLATYLVSAVAGILAVIRVRAPSTS
ncbi:MAG: hypothetical protein WB789_09510 [Thermoplasmata archaeon]